MTATRVGDLRAALLRRRHTVLLAALVILFGVRPLFGQSGLASTAFSLALLLLMLAALFATQVDELVGERDALVAQHRRRRIIGWVLAVPAIAERVFVLVFPSRENDLIASLCWLAFFAFVSWSELRKVLRQRSVTGETIRMSISVYLLLGMTWGALYIAIYQFDPDAFDLGGSPPASQSAARREEHVFPTLLYFSMTTLTTVGYGDITPRSMEARYAAIAEAVTGPFYLAILVARLVGNYAGARRESGDREGG
jgi:hypothetical protein